MSGSETCNLTVLVENTAVSGSLMAEHGWSVAVERGGQLGLWDTGQSDAVVPNACALGIDLSGLSWIALSHGHYDHTGGLEAVLDEAPGAAVYAHPAAFESKIVREEDGSLRDAGMPLDRRAVEAKARELVLNRGPAALAPGIRTTGEVPRCTPFEHVGERFCTRKEGAVVHDLFPDDESLILDTPNGMVVLLGCAHAGVVNTLNRVQAMAPGTPIHAVVGGMHLGNAPEERIERTVEAFREVNVERIGLAHCTGEAAIAAFEEALPGRCFPCPAGTRLTF